MHEQLFREMVKANFHRGGTKCLNLFHVRPDFFRTLKAEIQRLVEKNAPSSVNDQSHVTYWTKPYGTAVQYSLLNVSGKLDDTSTDHNWSLQGKTFHQAGEYPAIAEFIAGFPHAINMRLNGMGHKSGLSPHEENILRPLAGTRSKYIMRGRFHLPILTSPDAEILLDGELFHFKEGEIYYFNNGSVHSARNASTTQWRYHLVWDMLMTRETYDLMFRQEKPPEFLEAIPEAQRQVPVKAKSPQAEYQISERGLKLYQKCHLGKLGIKPWQFQNVFNALTYPLPRSVEFADPSNPPVQKG